MALTEADLERARELAAEAPPLTPQQRDRLRAMLSGCIPALNPDAATTETRPAAASDAA